MRDSKRDDDGLEVKNRDNAPIPGSGAAGGGVNRRDFLKLAGLGSAVAGGAGLGAFGYATGKDPNSHLGLQNEYGASLIFNRKRYRVDSPTYERVGH